MDSIIWGNRPRQIVTLGNSFVLARYSDIEGSLAGPGNLDVNPDFVQSGYWVQINDNSLILEPDDPQGRWTMGDYHLQTQAGRWDELTQSWTVDEATSVCIDAGDPNQSVGYEQPPHGDRINMGVYGGTVMASQSYVPVDDGPVRFSDDILKSKVQQALAALGVWWDPIPEDMLILNSLIASHSQIRDIAGLQYALNLQTLILRWNLITDISSLSGLTQLQHLDLSQNDISDLAPLMNLTHLKHLDLHWNQVEDLTPLSQLTGLQVLVLKHNRIKNLFPLSGLTALEELVLYSNYQIKDLSPLAGMTHLTTLSLQSNEVNDLMPLSGLTQLEYLNLKENNVADISPISQFRHLKMLNLLGNPLNRYAYKTYLDRILNNNPGIDLSYDPSPY